MTKSSVIYFLLAIVLYAGMLFLIDWRLRQVEQTRCQEWNWDICAKSQGNQMLLTPLVEKGK